MPSPFTHLHIAEKIYKQTEEKNLIIFSGSGYFDVGWPAFYLGSIAPDFQTLSGHPREMTHFYKLPPEPNNQAYPKMFAQYPSLALSKKLPISHGAFVAAYAAHLLLDLIWFREVLIPYFFNAPQLGDTHERRLLHLILLTYIDKFAQDQLPSNAAILLSQAEPHNWLPFVDDSVLCRWGEFISEQLQPGAISETIRIYAHRLNMTGTSFAAKLDDPEWMEDSLFSKIPIDKVFTAVYTAVPQSIELIENYWNGEFAEKNP